MAISAAEVKALRDETGAGMMDCKQALTEAGGDLEQARAILRQKGKAKGAKREGKATAEGSIAIATAPGGRLGVACELQCETDFVARGDDFRGLAATLAERVLERGLGDVASLGLADAFDDALTRLGEKLAIGHCARYEAAEGGVVACYLHTATHKVGVIIELGVEGDAEADAVAAIGRDVAMHITAMKPEYVDESQVPTERLEKEKEILRGAEDLASRPREIQDKIIEGRLRKGFFEQVCLVGQPFARDDEVTVAQYLAREGKSLGAKLSVRRFERVEVGRE